MHLLNLLTSKFSLSKRISFSMWYKFWIFAKRITELLILVVWNPHQIRKLEAGLCLSPNTPRTCQILGQYYAQSYHPLLIIAKVLNNLSWSRTHSWDLRLDWWFKIYWKRLLMSIVTYSHLHCRFRSSDYLLVRFKKVRKSHIYIFNANRRMVDHLQFDLHTK
jgi:hypothetical protein